METISIVTESIKILCIVALMTGSLSILALSLHSHWRVVLGGSGPSMPCLIVMRIMGYSAIGISLPIAVIFDGPSFGPILWVMLLTVGASIVAAILTIYPRLLRSVAKIFDHLDSTFQRKR